MITQKRKESFTYGNVLRITGYISLMVSIYLIGEHYGKGPSICGGGGADNTIAGIRASCTLVNHSKYSSILGIPVSFLGVSWNVILLLVGREILKGATSQHTPHSHLHQEQFIVFQLFWCLLGALFVFYFIWAEFMLKAICPMCTIVHILTLIQFFCAWKTYRLANLDILSEFEGPTWWWRLLVRSQVLKEWFCWILGVHLMLLICFIILPDVLSAPIDESLAKCIGSSPSVWMFGAHTCSVCQRQKAMFQPPGTFDKYLGPNTPSVSPSSSSSFGTASPEKHIDFLYASSRRYIECLDREGSGARLCNQMNITAYPTWIKFSPNEDGVFSIDKNRIVERLEGLQLALSLRILTDCVDT